VIVAADGMPSIRFTLPNNPEETSPAKLSFKNPPVHVFSYVREQHYELVAFSYWLCDKLIKESTDRNKGSFARVSRDWLSSSSQGAQGDEIPPESTLEEITARFAASSTS